MLLTALSDSHGSKSGALGLLAARSCSEGRWLRPHASICVTHQDIWTPPPDVVSTQCVDTRSFGNGEGHAATSDLAVHIRLLACAHPTCLIFRIA